MDQINSEILRQFESQGLTINEGIAVDARLVKSASRPKRNSPDGNLDKNFIPLQIIQIIFEAIP